MDATVAGDRMTFSVTDSGAGIPAEELAFVFDRYWQAKRTNRSGAGLGLSICKGLVQGHGGQIWVTSEVGKGTIVSFTLRVASTESSEAW